MKKLTLNQVSFVGAKVLTREELKKVMGGANGLTFESGDGCSSKACTKPADCPSACPTCQNFSTSGGYCK